MTPAIGLPLQPELEYLERVTPLLARDVDILEIAPETTWYRDARGELAPNRYHARFLALGARYNLPFIAHGVGFSPGSVDITARRERWLARLAADQLQFNYRWYTEHLGATVLADHELTLPLGLPMTPDSLAVTRAGLAAMQRVTPIVGLENSALYFALGDPLAEPAFLNAIVGDAQHLLLDLHNLHTMAENFGIDPADYLARLDLTRVLEIHLAGGTASDPAWLPTRRSLRLDSHDDHVPEPVWSLFEQVLPRCPGLRAVLVERMEGTLGPGDELPLRDELRRARRLVQQHHRPGPTTSAPLHPAPLPPELHARQLAHERSLAALLRAPDPRAAITAATDPLLRALDPDGVQLAALLIARLRFERLQHGDLAASQHFDRDPAEFTNKFRRYHHEVPPTAGFPQDESRLYQRWSNHE